MSDVGRKAHWENVYTTKSEKEVSWFQENPAPSLELIALAGLHADARIIDIGGGASRLVDALVGQKIGQVTVLDLSAAALDAAKKRLGDSGAAVEWVIADVTTWEPSQAYDLWHDRATFHFLTNASDRSAYVRHLKKAVRSGGHVIMGTFAPDGPERCSGLPVMRYDAGMLGAILGADFRLIDSRCHDHTTPWGAVQRFQFSTFRRYGATAR
jgi:2-polyprenyl-3-methyl-5-hydroxy-6-metoxy-1,4-benzoquinol methylase